MFILGRVFRKADKIPRQKDIHIIEAQWDYHRKAAIGLPLILSKLFCAVLRCIFSSEAVQKLIIRLNGIDDIHLVYKLDASIFDVNDRVRRVRVEYIEYITTPFTLC